MSITKTLQNLTLATLVTFTFVCAGLGTAFAGTCSIDTLPYWDGAITEGYLAQAQTFAAPSNACNILLEYEFNMAARSSAGQFQLNIFQWGTSGPSGGALYTTTLPWGTSPTTYDITGINLTLTPGQLYAAEVDFLGYNGQSIYFQNNQTGDPGFDGWWYNPASGGWADFQGLNTNFMAKFGSVPEPSSLALLGAGVVGVAGVLRRKMKR